MHFLLWNLDYICNIAHKYNGLFTYVNGTESLIEHGNERWSRVAAVAS